MKKISLFALIFFCVGLGDDRLNANPWNGKLVLQGFWWGCWNENYPQDWYTYLAKLAPRLRDMGFDGIWIPSPTKGWQGVNDMGYGIYDHYDLGDKDQKSSVATRFGDKDDLLRFIAVAHANGLEVYPDIVLNHLIGGDEDPAAPGNKFKKFRYAGFAGPEAGRWAKDHWNFHPNPDHACSEGDICGSLVGQDICYLGFDNGGGGNGQYMRDRAREWFVWFRKQTDADGFRMDAVKHFQPYVVEDLLFHAMGPNIEYFCAGEFVSGKNTIDQWATLTQNRCGTFDFSLRNALATIVEAGGFFDMGSLPDFQQNNRLKSSPFINNHDTWKGAFWDSANADSIAHDDREGDWRQNGDEILPTIDPDNPRTKIAYAAALAVDGSPTIYYEDLFVNFGADRFRADPANLQTRDYLINLIWAHQKLNFKDGAYKVRYRGSQDLLVIERAGKALIGMNDGGDQSLSAWVETDFGPRVALHDYSGATGSDLKTSDDGWVRITVPPMSYAIWAPPGVGGGFSPSLQRTNHEFELDDDLGDSRASSPRYGGKLCSGELRIGGSIWAAAATPVHVELYTDGEREAELVAFKPDGAGAKRIDQGQHTATDTSSNTTPLELAFTAEREGYYQLAARITQAGQDCARAYIKAQYQAPAESDKF